MSKKPTLLAIIFAAAAVQACSEAAETPAAEITSEDVAASEPTANPVAGDSAADEAAVPQEEARADWTQLNDSAIRAQIDQRLAAFQEEYFDRFNLLVVEQLEGEDRWQAAGLAASEQGGPTIVVATGQRDVQIVGDEALAYLEEDRIRLQNDLAAHFDRGEFVAGFDNFLSQIVPIWYGD